MMIKIFGDDGDDDEDVVNDEDHDGGDNDDCVAQGVFRPVAEQRPRLPEEQRPGQELEREAATPEPLDQAGIRPGLQGMGGRGANITLQLPFALICNDMSILNRHFFI